MSRPRVLLVEDHTQMQEMIQKLLAPEYDIVGVVERGDDVLNGAKQLLPGIVVLDISLPGRSGMQVLPELRAEFPGMGIVMLTTLANPLYHEEALARGADGFVA